MTPDQRTRRMHPYVADLPKRPQGWGMEYDRLVLKRKFDGPEEDRWHLMSLRAYFAS